MSLMGMFGGKAKGGRVPTGGALSMVPKVGAPVRKRSSYREAC
jgi:hypothetical protein